ncbi:unnamed protein product, partial [Ectocarpus sp. 12 AP-2014]
QINDRPECRKRGLSDRGSRLLFQSKLVTSWSLNLVTALLATPRAQGQSADCVCAFILIIFLGPNLGPSCQPLTSRAVDTSTHRQRILRNRNWGWCWSWRKGPGLRRRRLHVTLPP